MRRHPVSIVSDEVAILAPRDGRLRLSELRARALEMAPGSALLSEGARYVTLRLSPALSASSLTESARKSGLMVAPIVIEHGKRFILTDEIVVRFNAGWDAGQIESWAAGNGYRVVSTFPDTRATVSMSVDEPSALRSLSVANELIAWGDVAYAYPNWIALPSSSPAERRQVPQRQICEPDETLRSAWEGFGDVRSASAVIANESELVQIGSIMDRAIALAFDLRNVDILISEVDTSGRRRFDALSSDAIDSGVHSGRGGRGTVYLVDVDGAAGIETSYDELASSTDAIVVAGVDCDGRATSAVTGSNILISAPSVKGTVVMTVADTIAMMLDVNPSLTVRDIKEILVRTAIQTDPEDAGWVTNGAGRWIHPQMGFGRIDIASATSAAPVWRHFGKASVTRAASRPELAILEGDSYGVSDSIRLGANMSVEHVEVFVTIPDHARPGDLEIVLRSPMGTESVLARGNGSTALVGGLERVKFMTVRHWGEDVVGEWTLRVRDRQAGVTGTLSSWEIAAYGVDRSGTNRAGVCGNLTTTDLSTVSPTALINTMLGGGVEIFNLARVGANIGAGIFDTLDPTNMCGGRPDVIGFKSGIILSSGDISDVIGPNSSDGISVDSVSGTDDGDELLDDFSGFDTHDASSLEFDFVPNSVLASFQYVFSSDEYNEFVNSSFNDTFAFFVNNTNCAIVGDTAVTINSINNGNPLGDCSQNPCPNAASYINNDPSDGCPPGTCYNTEMDGLTVVLKCETDVNSDRVNTMKLAIADASDSILDSNVFIEAGSFKAANAFVAGDLDGNGKDELIVNFGAAYGIYVLYNGTTWSFLHPFAPDKFVTGDLDGNGMDDLIVDFGRVYGVYGFYNNSGWRLIHSVTPTALAVGNLNGNASQDLIIDFATGALYAYYDNATWGVLNTASTYNAYAADVDADGIDEVIADYEDLGMWIYDPSTNLWRYLTEFTSEIIAVGQFDGVGGEDIVADLNQYYGLWFGYNGVNQNTTDWVRIHRGTATSLAVGKLDGTAVDDIVVDFGAYGIYTRTDGAVWQQIHPMRAEYLITGDFNGNGIDDVAVDFGAGLGIYVYYDNATWVNVHPFSPG